MASKDTGEDAQTIDLDPLKEFARSSLIDIFNKVWYRSNMKGAR